MGEPPPGETWVSVHEPLLGTRVELRVRSTSPAAAADAERAALREVQRLEAVFSVFDPTSELRRWRAGDDRAAGPELRHLLAVALRWQARSGGTFNPAVGTLADLWAQAARRDAPPEPGELAERVAAIASPPYAVADDDRGDHGRVRRLGDCSTVDLNAIAKGHIVDRAVAAALAVGGVDSVTVNAGGDLLHQGAGSLLVGIEDPARPYDNEPPLVRIRVARQALATSGSARRGVRVGGRWFGHVLDPRTGWPVDLVTSASVVAPDAATADVVATVVGVLEPTEGLAFVADLDDIGCCLVDRDGAIWRDPSWSVLEGGGAAPGRSDRRPP